VGPRTRARTYMIAGGARSPVVAHRPDPPPGSLAGEASRSHRLRSHRRILVLIVAAFVVALAYWGVGVEPSLLDQTQLTAEVPGLPASWDGQRVALIADLQIGMWPGNEGTSRRAIDRIIFEPPAAVLVAGDLLYGRDDTAAKIERVVDLLAVLPWSGIPTVAVLGNHDHGSGAAVELTRRLEAIGVTVLENDSVALPPPGGKGDPLHVVGIGPHLPGLDRPVQAVSTVPEAAARIVVMHNPASFGALPAGTAPLAMAGHTHGGQVRVPLWDWPVVDLLRRPALGLAGWTGEAGGARGNRLFVSRGIGMSGIPVRFNCRPELTMITLRRPR
jgi:predicted MPP superfamily phosphohydrolase